MPVKFDDICFDHQQHPLSLDGYKTKCFKSKNKWMCLCLSFLSNWLKFMKKMRTLETTEYNSFDQACCDHIEVNEKYFHLSYE